MGMKMIKVLDRISEKHNPSGWINYKSCIEWDLIDAILEDLGEHSVPKGQILFDSVPGFKKSIKPLSPEDLKRNRNTILYSNLEYAQSMRLLSVNQINPESDLEILVRILEEISEFSSDRKREFLLQSLQGRIENREYCIQNIVVGELENSTKTDFDLMLKLINRESQKQVEQMAERYFTSEKSKEVIENARQEYKLRLLEKQSIRIPVRRMGVQYTLTRKGSAYLEYGWFKRWVMRKTSFLNPTWVILGVIVSAKPFVESLTEGARWLAILTLDFFELLQGFIASS